MATSKVGQRYVITTVDQGAYRQVIQLVWSHPIIYRDHIILLGIFHINKAYLHSLGKKMRGSGLEDVLLEAKLTNSGSIDTILNATDYNRALYILKIIVETLERLMLELFIEVHEPPAEMKESVETVLFQIISNPTKEVLEEVLSNPSLQEYVSLYLDFQDTIRKGDRGLTPQYWLSISDSAKLVIYLHMAAKTNDFTLYKWVIYEMCPQFFAWNCQNYARYLTYHSRVVDTIEDTHPGATKLLEAGCISVAKTKVKACRTPVDMRVEQGINRFGKSRGGSGSGGAGFVGTMTNPKAMRKWARTTHLRAAMYEQTLLMADMIPSTGEPHGHKDSRPTEIMDQEEDVQRTHSTFKNAYMNPFDVPGKDLYVIVSGQRVPADIAADIINRDQWGRDARDKFVHDRLERKAELEKDRDIHKPIPRCKLQTFQTLIKEVKLTLKSKIHVSLTIEYLCPNTL